MPALLSSSLRAMTGLGQHWAWARGRVALGGCLVTAGLVPFVASAAASTTTVDLGRASTYAVLSGASVANTFSADGAPHTTLRGDLGVKANSQPSGFPPGVVTGGVEVGNAAAAAAHADLEAAYDEVAGRTDGAALTGTLAGATITPGLYRIAGAVSNTTTVTLNGGGDPNAVFVFQVNGALDMAAGSHVVLVNGAQASRVFWQVNGAGAIGAGADFAGTLMALNAVTLGHGALVNGRAFARNGALTLDANEVYSAPPVVTIAGGTAAITTDTMPTISGTTDVEAPAVVTVTIHGQTLTAAPSAGAWSVTSAILANDTYAVVAAVVDGAGNRASAAQQLTVDTVPPVVTLDGGASVTTNDPTPTIAGSADVAPGALVHVAVDAQTLLAVVQSTGTWNVTPAPLADGTRTVSVSVTDPAGNPGVDDQALTVDTTAPTGTIAGGANALTNDATPGLSGSAGVAPGTTVTVSLADETLTGVVQDGTWSVTASALADGPHRVVMAVSDTAGNPASVTQTLTVDTVAPIIAITGGGTAVTSDVTPTLVGTSDAAPNTTITVSIAGQTMTALVQANGTWNATPAVVAHGTWAVVASAPDPAGNVGRAGQTLTIAADAAWPTEPALPVPVVTPAPVTPPAVTPPAVILPPDTPPAVPPAEGGSTNTADRTTVDRNGRQRVKGSSLTIPTTVTAPSGGRVVVTARGTVRIKGVKRAIQLTGATATILAGRSATLTLRLKGMRPQVAAACRKIRAATKAGTKASATLTIRIVDAAGTTRQVQRTVTLTR